LLDENVAAAKEHGTRAAPGFAHAPTQICQVLIGIDDVALGGLSRHVIISTVVEGDPEPAKPLGSGNVWPPHG
jgi:hypothetical protein